MEARLQRTPLTARGAFLLICFTEMSGQRRTNTTVLVTNVLETIRKLVTISLNVGGFKLVWSHPVSFNMGDSILVAVRSE